jgi:hypothetical protein
MNVNTDVSCHDENRADRPVHQNFYHLTHIREYFKQFLHASGIIFLKAVEIRGSSVREIMISFVVYFVFDNHLLQYHS